MENSFLEFNPLYQWGCEGVALPIKKSGSFRTLADSYLTFDSVVKLYGTVITENGCQLSESGDFVFNSSFLSDLEIGTCFRFKVKRGLETLFSQIFRVVPDDNETSRVEYWCDENAFGFPYEEDFANSVFLPLRLYDVQYPQKEKIYQKKNGENVVLSSKIEEEWRLETEYIPLGWHKKIIVALSHDHVRINGKNVVKKEAYKIDYNNEIVTECGEKLYKGTCVVRGDIMEKNSNC